MSVTAVLRTIRSVTAAMWASSVVGDEEKNGGLWGSPIAKTSRPTSSARRAICTIASMRSASLGVRPVTGFRVMSLTEKIPNCIADRLGGCTHNYSGYMTAHVCGPCARGGQDAGDLRRPHRDRRRRERQPREHPGRLARPDGVPVQEGLGPKAHVLRRLDQLA